MKTFQSVCLFVSVLVLFTGAVWAQKSSPASGSPYVYVSSGNSIYSVNTVSRIAQAIYTDPNVNASYEGLIVGPDDAGDSADGYLLYACDPTNSTIIRFDPNNLPSPSGTGTLGTVYTGSLPLQCGRFDDSGDLIVTSTSGGWYEFAGIAAKLLGSGPYTPSPLASSSGKDEGIAQKNTGDLLVVDNANGDVLRSFAPDFTKQASSALISGLQSPVGIARRSDGTLFVGEQGVKTSDILQYTFNALGEIQPASPCTSFSKKLHDPGAPSFMQMSLDDTLYVAATVNNKGAVYAFDADTCQLTNSISLSSPAVGIALPPTSVTQNVKVSGGEAIVNFGFGAFVITQVSSSCSGPVMASIDSPYDLTNLAGLPVGQAAVNDALDGFELVFNTDHLSSGCTPNGPLNFQIAEQLPTSVTNPTVVYCEPETSPNPGCHELLASSTSATDVETGVWPYGGYLPADLTIGGTKTGRSKIFMVNPPITGAGGSPSLSGSFCLYQSPVNNTFDLSNYTQDLTPSTVNEAITSTLPIKFKVADLSQGGICQNGPFLTNVTAFLSIALVPSGTQTFIPMGVNATGGSSSSQPYFKSDNNQQYSLGWNLNECQLPSGAIGTCPTGTYALTLTLVNVQDTQDTSPPQTIYTVLTTLVNVINQP